MTNEPMEINVFYERTTDKAVLVKNSMGRKAWIAKKMIKDKDLIKGEVDKFRITIPEWLYDKLDWV